MSLWTVWLASSATWAFAPTDAVFTGIEPQRVRWLHGETQARWLATPAFQRFAETDGSDWRATFDEATGTPRTLWGRGIPVPVGDSGQLTAALAALITRHADLFGVRDAPLALRSARYDAQFDTWYVDFDTLREGLPTYRSGISARIKHGNLVLLHVATSPDAPVTGSRRLLPADAVTRAIADGPAPGAIHTETSAAPMLLERASLRGLELRQAWMVRTRTADPPGIWVTFVDAETSELLSVHNEVRFIQGTVSALHHERTLDGSPLIESPLPLVVVDGATDSDTTDASGTFDVTSSATYTTDLHGDYVDADNDAGSDGVLVANGSDLLWTSASATQAEIDTYVFLNQVKLWGERVAPTVPWISSPFESVVNIGSTCNAYWDGNTNFYSEGDGCNNTGQIADVNYHEWGHGFHYWSIEAGYFDGSLSEGAADVVSFLNTGDNLIAPFFGTSGWAIRDVAPDQVYPEDYVDNPYYVHTNGLIFGGAMWDLWDALVDDLGEEDGTTETEQIFVGLLKGGSDIPGTYFEALVADDDDGDLNNGTPHICSIMEAFGAHGLGTAEGGALYLIGHEPLVRVPADVPTPVTVDITSIAPECVSVVPASATLHWSVDGGAWREVATSVTGSALEAEIPALSSGAFVEYWLDGADTSGGEFSAPFSGAFAPYSFFVGDVIQIDCDDFEANDGGYRHTLLEGEDVEGADDWQWGLPNGQSDDPAQAASGTQIWGNDLGHDNYNGAYQASKGNRLRSERVETGHYTEVFLQYQRWLNIEDGTFDQAVITTNGDEVWSNWVGVAAEDEHHQDRQWVSHSVDLQGLADQGSVQVGWELYSDGGLEMGGWNIDDVCILAPATPDNRLGIVDFTTTDVGGPIALAWTHPPHLPVERVVVMRKVDDWPTGHDDGDLVLDVTDPVAGEAYQGLHLNVDGRSGHYAVYAFDGADWLSWTVEGWNASFAAPNNGSPGPDGFGGDGTEEPSDVIAGGGGGCGCSSDGTRSPWGSAIVLSLLLRRRRA